MQISKLDDLRATRAERGVDAHEFLRVPAMSLMLYELEAGAEDTQAPHAEDEVYYVISGRAQFEAGGERRPVEPGDTIFVEARAPHRFVEIAEDLSLLVVFAPAYTG